MMASLSWHDDDVSQGVGFVPAIQDMKYKDYNGLVNLTISISEQSKVLLLFDL